MNVTYSNKILTELSKISPTFTLRELLELVGTIECLITFNEHLRDKGLIPSEASIDENSTFEELNEFSKLVVKKLETTTLFK